MGNKERVGKCKGGVGSRGRCFNREYYIKQIENKHHVPMWKLNLNF